MQNAILITGAAGGLGQAIVQKCLERFPTHMIVAADVSEKIFELFDKKVFCLHLDVSDENSIAAGRKSLEEAGLQVSMLVNNAAVSDFFAVSSEPKASLDRMFSINTFGAVNSVREFLPHLHQAHGRVVNISSESIRAPAPFNPYAASKTALEALSVIMRNELALKNIKLVIIRPGAIATPFLDDLYQYKKRIGEGPFKHHLNRFAEQAPKQVRRIAKPEKVADVVIRALSKKKPCRYYHVNNNPLLRIARLLPHSLRDTIMQRMIR